MYKINLTMRKFDSDVEMTKSLSEYFNSPAEANLRIKELAEKEKLRRDVRVKLVQHHAGLSVVFYNNDNYKEYWRSYENLHAETPTAEHMKTVREFDHEAQTEIYSDD